MPSARIEFESHAGDRLAARLDLPDGPPRAYALFAHCFTCTKDLAAARRIAQRLSAMGLGVLRFDFTGLGHSGGEFANTTFTSNVEDLIRAAEWLGENHSAPQLLIGHSFGGAAALAAAHRIPGVRALAVINAPADPGHVLRNFGAKVGEICETGAAEVDLAGRKFTIGKQFVEDVSKTKLSDALAHLKAALLVLHAPLDQIVSIENASAIFTAAKHPKSFVTLDDSDHLLTRPEDGDYAAEVIAAWSRRYIELSPEAAPFGAPEGIVTAREADAEGFVQDILFGPKHALVADEPASVGGTNLGPSPYDLLSAGLAACTSMTIRMYARRKGLPLDHVWVDVEHGKIHAKDCEDCQSDGGKIDEFRRTVHLTGDLTDEQRARLLEIANRCPVHQTMESEIKVRTRLG